MINYLKSFWQRIYFGAILFNESSWGWPFIPFIPFIVLFGGFDDKEKNVNKSVANLMFSSFLCVILGLFVYVTLVVTLITRA